MQKLFTTLSISLLLLYLFTPSLSQPPPVYPHIPLLPGETLIRHMEGWNQVLYFNFTVENLQPHQDLLFTVSPLDWLSNPDILISAINPYPIYVNEAEYLCWTFGSDVCPVPESQLAEKKTFYVTVYCRFTCSFTIQAHYDTKNALELNQAKTLFFNAENSAEGHVLKLVIPTDFTGDHITIQAIPSDFETLNHSISLFINKGDVTPSANTHMVMALPAWHGGVSFSFRRGMDFFCTGCEYSMLLTAKDNIGVSVLARETSQEVKLELKKRVYDFAFEEQVMQYVLEVNSSSIPRYKNRDINIELRPYTGNPDLFINLNTRPNDLSAYTWVSNEFGIEALRISPEDRNTANTDNQEIERYYIAVYSPRASTFSLMAYLDNKNRKPIGLGMAETGYVGQQQVETYMLEIPSQTEGQYDITVSLHALSGNPDLYLMSCPENYGDSINGNSSLSLCQITEDQIKQYNSGATTIDGAKFFMASTSSSGNEQLVFHNGPPACTLTEGDCMYAIAVYGNTEGNAKSHYSVLATHNKVQTILQEQVPVKHSLQVGEYQYYKFTVPDASNLLSVHFQLTPISGEAAIFSAKRIEYPTIESFEKTACFCAHIITYCGFNLDDIPLNATYYVAAYALSHTTYTITAITRSSIGPNVIQLMEGVPHRFVFPTTGGAQQQAYFRFRADFSTTSPTEIHINLITLRGGPFKLLLSEGFLPDNQTAVWSSITNKLSISSQDIQFVASGNYFITVIPFDPHDLTKTEFDTKNWQFTIQYYSSSTNIVELVEGNAALGRASAEKPAFFRFAVNKDDKDIAVKLTQFGKPLELYLSTSSENPYPSADSKDFEGETTLTLSRDDIAKFCHDSENGQVTGSHCPVYVGVYADNTEGEDQEFSITIEKPNTLIHLQEGLTDSHEILGENWHVDYVIIPKKDQDISISLVSKLPLDVYVTVIDTKAHPHSSDWTPEENDENLVKDQESHYIESRITLTPSRWEQYADSVVIIRLKRGQKEDITPTDSLDSHFFCTITYLGSLNRLLDSHVTFGRVQGGLYHFYKLQAGKGTNKLLKVFLTPLTSGVPELYLQADTIPTRNNYLYRSQDPSNPSITVEDAKGEYYLSIYSPDNSSYSLVFTTLPETFLKIELGLPVSVVSCFQHEEGVYFIYTPARPEIEFKVLYSKEAGDPELYLTGMSSDSQDRENQLPTAEKHQYSTLENGLISVTHKQGESPSGEYVIFLKNDGSNSENKATVLVAEKGSFVHLPSGKSFKDSVKQSDINYYYYLSQDLAEDEHVEISLVIYNGNPELYASVTPDVLNNPVWKASQADSKQSSSIVLKILRENSLVEPQQEDSAAGQTGSVSLLKGQILYMGVRGTTDSLYDIRISVGRRTTSLEDGIMSSGVINGKESKKFTFNSPYETSENKLITLVFTVLSDGKNGPSIFPEIKIGYVPAVEAATMEDRREDDHFIETHFEERRSQSSRIYRFVAKRALYLITLSSSLDVIIHYSMSLNVKGVIMLPPNNEMLAYLTEGDSDVYQVYTREPGNMLIQFEECFGNSTLSIASSRQAYLNNDFSTQISRPMHEQGYSLIEVKPGTIYLKVTASKGWVMFTPLGKGNESAYKIAVYFLPSAQKAPHQLVVPGNHGKIQAWKTEPGKYKVHWNNIMTLAEDRQEKKNAEGNVYEMIYFSKSLRALNMAAKCELIPGTEFVFTIEHSEDMKVWSFPSTANSNEKELEKEIEIDTPENDNSPFFVTVTAKVQSSLQAGPASYSVPVAMFYQQTEAEEPLSVSIFAKKVHKASWIVLGVVVSLVIVISACAVWKYFKKRNVNVEIGRPDRFEYELGRVQEEESPAGVSSDTRRIGDLVETGSPSQDESR